MEHSLGLSMVACFGEEAIVTNGLQNIGFVRCIIFELQFLVSVSGSEATCDMRGYLGQFTKSTMW